MDHIREVSDKAQFSDDFCGTLDKWSIEQQPGGSVFLEDGVLVIDDKGGCTVWFREELVSPVKIKFRNRVSSSSRISDMNCFWMATNPKSSGNILENGNSRDGKFEAYDDLSLYYVGYGGNYNTTTRFRKYHGNGVKPLLPEFDLTEKAYMIEADREYDVELVSDGELVRYSLNGKSIFEYKDEKPLVRGWFGFRTVWSRQEIRNFQVDHLGV